MVARMYWFSNTLIAGAASAPAMSSGYAVAPPPVTTLLTASGCRTARKRAAPVPTSGATRCGVPEPELLDELAEELRHDSGSVQVRAALGMPDAAQVDRDQPAS